MKLISLLFLFVLTLSFQLFSFEDERFVVDKTTFAVSEDGTTDSFSLSLKKAPTDDVVVSFIDDTNEAIVNGTFTFTPTNWNVAQSVTVEGVVDNIIDGDQNFDLKFKSTSSDESFEFREMQVASGRYHTCALLKSGAVRCWGRGTYGQLGYGNTDNIGDNETPVSAGDVDVGGAVKQITAGYGHTCALLESGAVRCWGDNRYGELGYGNTDNIGDDENETPATVGDVDVGGTVKHISAGDGHTCALLKSGAVRCWGRNGDGQLGYGNTDDIGDDEDETPATAGDVNIGGVVKQITAGRFHTCALLESGAVRCWGYNRYGQLGYENTDNIGNDEDETPATAGDVNVGGTVKQISAGDYHTCALLESGAVRCWGWNIDGQLGYGNTDTIGNDEDETPATAGDVDVGGTVKQILAGDYHTCALLESGAVRCWGQNSYGQLGYGNTENIGDELDETPVSAGDVDVGGAVKQITAGYGHTCALLESGTVRCWGWSNRGQLGYGNTDNIGDDETPLSAGDVKVTNGTEIVTQITAGDYHTCALLDTGKVRCWGDGGLGQLGYGTYLDVGTGTEHFSKTIVEAGDVSVGGNVVQIAASGDHTCAILDSGAVRCWGQNSLGQLGYNHTNNIGYDTIASSGGDIAITENGESVIQLTGGYGNTCALLDTGALRCWGNNSAGQLGHGNTINVGDGEEDSSTIIEAGDAAIGAIITQVAMKSGHACAVLENGAIRCWGYNGSGQLGYDNIDHIGDDELPSSVGDNNVAFEYDRLVINGVNSDIDTAGILVTTNGTEVSEEGASSNFSVVLESKPISDVVFDVSTSNSTEGSVSVDSITFTPVNWNVSQEITVTGVDDSIQDGDTDFSVDLTPTTLDPNYSTLAKTITYTNLDDSDAAGVLITPTGNITSENGGSIDVEIVLTSEPDEYVQIDGESNNTNEGVVSQNYLYFSQYDWNVPQTMTITGVDDYEVDTNQEYSVSFYIQSNDSNYTNLLIDDLILENETNDKVATSVLSDVNIFSSVEIGTLNIQTELSGYSVSVMDLKGRAVYSRNNLSGDHRIDLGSSARGQYFVMFRKDNIKMSKAIIVR